MAGRVKVDSSTWGSVADMYVKTGTTSWSRATEAYVKVDGSTWTRWFLAAIKDSFGRSTSGSLGSSDTSQPWTNRTGTWYANGSQAQSDTAASSYPVASVVFPANDVTVSASVTGGTGPAVWVSSSGDWYAAILFWTQVNSTYACNCSCNGHYESYSYPVYNSCASCSACGSFVSGGSSYAATNNPTQTFTGYSYYGSASGPNYSCPNGGTLNGTRCETTTVTQGQTISLGCVSGFSGCANYSYPYGETPAPGICGCATGQNRVCCTQFIPGGTTTSSYTATISYSCPGGTVCCQPGSASCYTATYSTVNNYSCPSGGTLSGTTCIIAGTTTCYSCQNSSCGVSYYASGSTFVSGGTYPNCDSYGASCQTCGTLTNSYFLRILKSVNGVVTSPASDITLPSQPAAIRMTTSGNTITYQAFADTSLTSPIGTQGSITESSPNKIQNYGIIKAPTTYGQGSTVDNFQVSG